MSQPSDQDAYGVEPGDDVNPAGAAPPATGPRFDSHLRDGVHLVTFSRGDVLDSNYIDQLGDDLKGYYSTLEQPKVVIDMAKVQHMSSAALGMLLVLKNALESCGGGLRLANVPPDLMKVFKLTKLNKLLGIHKDTRSAVESF